MDFTKVDEFLDGLIGNLVPSNDIIIMKDHRILHRHMCGYADYEEKLPITEDALYFMYSSTKPVTCAAIMLLCERGLFALDDPLCEYLPEFSEMQVTFTDTDGKKKHRPAKTPITIRHLLTMTAGFDYNIAAASIREAIQNTAPECPTREIIRGLAKVPLCFDPGTKWQYSLCHDVLPALAEVLCGIPFRDFVQANFFDPLGMTESTFFYDSTNIGRIVPQYMYYDRDEEFRKVKKENEYIFGSRYDSGGGGMISSTADMAKFADMMACGGTTADGYRILRPETIKLMQTNMLTPELMPDFNWDQYRGYGYGLGVRTLITHDTGALSSIGEFGWAGAAGTYMLCDPAERLSVFCSRQMLNNKEPFITPKLRNLVYQCL